MNQLRNRWTQQSYYN